MEPSHSFTPSAERDGGLLVVGKQCAHTTCSLVDFLPFKCQHCQESFCQEHFKVEVHHCPKYDETKHNRVAPNCPMCNVPVAIKPGQDPNIRMEEHFSRECTAIVGKPATRTVPTCSRGNCKKVLYTPIRCDICRKDYCASHRFPEDHNCSSTPTAVKSTAPSWRSASHPVVAKFSASSSRAVGTKKVVNNNAATASSSSKANTTSPLSIPSPFNKTDRRARAERISRIKAMQERAKKGLLSEREKAILADEEAELERNGKGECVMM